MAALLAVVVAGLALVALVAAAVHPVGGPWNRLDLAGAGSRVGATGTVPTVPEATGGTAGPVTTAPKPVPAPGPSPTTVPRSEPVATVPAPAPAPAVAATAPVTLAGCPVPPHAPLPPSPPPWHPAVLVPDSSLPATEAPAPWRSSLTALAGKGMWIWEWSQTAGGNVSAVVAQARAAGLHQLWVRVGDSMNGFYGASTLSSLMPAAHAAGLDVIAWGFPYLYDPVGDARWTAQVLAFRDSTGRGVDGYSADLERPSEGVDLTANRVAVYLEQVRHAAGSVPVIATVYPPIDSYWSGGYPYRAMAPYVDAFAPMIYWECTDPGADARIDVARLATLRPVHVIGQAFNLADVGGRAVPPSAAEIEEFLAAARSAGAVGGSLWSWQAADADEWQAISAFPWTAR